MHSACQGPGVSYISPVDTSNRTLLEAVLFNACNKSGRYPLFRNEDSVAGRVLGTLLSLGCLCAPFSTSAPQPSNATPVSKPTPGPEGCSSPCLGGRSLQARKRYGNNQLHCEAVCALRERRGLQGQGGQETQERREEKHKGGRKLRTYFVFLSFHAYYSSRP